jgi:predicted alpha/beta-fold hydrolase
VNWWKINLLQRYLDRLLTENMRKFTKGFNNEPALQPDVHKNVKTGKGINNFKKEE